MDGDRMCDFDTVYKSILENFEILRSIHVSNKTANHLGILENVINAERSQCHSVRPTENTIQESITDKQIHRAATEDGMAFETQERADNQTQGETSCKDKENGGRLSKTVTRPSSQSIEDLRKQAKEWACEQIIGVFEDHSREVGKIGTLNHDMSEILKNVTKVLQEKVEEVQVKHKKVADLEEALSAEKNLVDAVRQKERFLQELLDKAFDIAENGIFMCGQCQFVAEKVKEPHIHAKKDPNPINCQFIVKGQMETCHSTNKLQSTKDSTSSVHYLFETEDGKKGSFISSPSQRINNLDNICARKLNGTHQILGENGCAVTCSKLANGNDRRADPEIEIDVTTHSNPLSKRKWLDDGHDKEGESLKAPKISAQVPNMQCSDGSKACYSVKTPEAYYIKDSHCHSTAEQDFICDLEKNEDGEHSMGQAAAFTLLLEEEFEDDSK